MAVGRLSPTTLEVGQVVLREAAIVAVQEVLSVIIVATFGVSTTVAEVAEVGNIGSVAEVAGGTIVGVVTTSCTRLHGAPSHRRQSMSM